MKIEAINLMGGTYNKDQYLHHNFEEKEVFAKKNIGNPIQVEISDIGQEMSRNNLYSLDGYGTYESIDVEDSRNNPDFEWDVAYFHYMDMRAIEGGNIGELKKTKASYNVCDVMQNKLDSYAIMYDRITKGHEDGTRQVYINPDGNGRRLMTLEEDLEYLDQAFERNLVNLEGYIYAQQCREWETFIGNKGFENDFEDKRYRDNAYEMMKEAQKEFKERLYTKPDEKDSSIIAKNIISSIFLRNREFIDKTSKLFDKIQKNNLM